ncbi:MAG: caspase family protein [Hyphomonadaceae bacterium]|nr:caspase family protein [Hyphomonadaceae bacterium]
MRAWVMGLLAAFVLFAGPAQAQERRVALVIGVSSYENAPALPNPLNDAVDTAAALALAGFEVVESYDPDYAGLQRAVRDFSRKLPGAQVGLVYYAGHGVQVGGRNYLLPVDAKLADEASVTSEALDVNQILEALAGQPRTSLVFLDACRNNPLAANLARRAGAARSLAVSQGLAQVDAVAPNTLIAYATQPGATAADGAGRNSPFTSALLRHVPAPGLDVQDLMRRVRTEVIAATDGVQVPWENSSLTGGFSFVAGRPGAAPPPATWTPPVRDPTPRQLDIATWNDVKNKSAEEIQSYITRYPQGVFVETARARLAALQRAQTADRDRNRAMAQDIAREFAAIAGRGAIIAEPKEPQDFYANARLYELRGDFLNARRSYLGFFNFGLAFVDPHYRFQTFLRVQEGRAGAREVYGELAGARRGDETMQYAAALLQEPDVRKARLEQIVASRPDFAPAIYELARNYSEAALGSQTLADKEKERDLLTRFVALADSGRFLRWFIDQTVASEQLDDARRRLTALSATAVAQPVTMIATRSNQGWGLTFTILEATQEIFVRIGDGPNQSTGFQPFPHPATGKPFPRLYVDAPANAARAPVVVTYRDASGAMRGPFTLRFDPDKALFEQQKSSLETTRNAWLTWNDYDGRRLLYFTHLIGSRCALAEVRYGLDTMTPNRVFAMAPCDRSRPGEIPMSPEIFIETPMTTRFASVQLQYTDGTRSTVERFDVR